MMFRCAFFLLFLTIGLATTTDGPTTPAPMTTAITETTAAPVVTTAAPVVTTAAPVVTTEAPVVTTEAPVVTTAAPVVTTEAPVVTTAAPVVTTAAPVVTTAAPVVTTAAPVVTTAAPVVTTVEPVVTTVEPVVTTVEPDVNVTTTAPATNATTLAPATNATTAEPVTNATTAAPVSPTTPTPSLPTPTTGQYNVTSPNGTCLMAKFGLRISLKEGETSQDVNLDPSGTAASGVCGPDSSDLVLTSDKITIMLTFTTEAKKFQLHSLNVTVKSSSGAVFVEANTNLSLWQAALGSSYMCNKQQNFNITNSLTLHTFDLRVQPFEVQKAEFSTAEECPAEPDDLLVPIAVGVALAVLICIVLLAYFIGRKRNLASGYESF